MSDTIIQYDEMVQNALLSVVRDILQRTAEEGLPGEHHFYITFRTDNPDVKIPPYLRERYPDEMTIVLQNQFWDLMADDEHFEISLSFNRKKEHLYVPLSALIGFFDPSVDFGLHFHSNELDEMDDETESHVEYDAETGSITGFSQKPDDSAGTEKNTDDGDNVVTLDSFRKK
ncbi:SspB family protein [Emcibacter sp.]|uniref:SspB family protein n=1 Tax=Emcibacter sp. TaxID=1979954 RepID=UPI002AA87270|nr:ClpXP protease specificity-enhancing factor SspB [Emcibacter sp.]